MDRLLNLLPKICVVATACAGIWDYLNFVSPRKIEYATEQRDNSETRVVKKITTKIGEDFTAFPIETPSKISIETLGEITLANWPCFRGSNRDNIVQETIPLTKTWDENGPNVLWRQSLGEGYAGAIIANGRVYILDYLEDESSDSLRCFDLFSGNELWRRSYKNPIRRNHGKSRTVPAYSDQVVVALGPAGHVMAVDSITGDLLWSCDLVETYGCEVPQWYVGQCPLIENGSVILGIGGETVLMAAFDLKTGQTLWEMENSDHFVMSHASVLPAIINGEKQYIYAAIGGITACDETGKTLWNCTDWKPAVWAPTPIQIDSVTLFLTAGYGAGSALLKLDEIDGRFEPTIESQWKPTQGPASEQQTPLLIDGILYVVQPKDAGSLRGELVAAAPAKLPEILASSGKQGRFGLGPYLYADGAFWIADDSGGLHVYTYENGSFVKLAHHKVLPGVDSWGPIACAGGFMVLRDSTSMVCLDLREKSI